MVGVVVTYDIDTTYAVINKIHQSYIVKQMYKIRPTYANLHGSWHFRTYYKKTKVPRNKRLRRPLPTLQHYILNITVAHKIRNIGSLTLLNLLPYSRSDRQQQEVSQLAHCTVNYPVHPIHPVYPPHTVSLQHYL